MMHTYQLSNFRILPISTVEELKQLNFPDSEVLKRDEDIRVRATNLDKAVSLGLHQSEKASITLQTNEGLKKIECIVFTYDGKHVWINGNIQLPICAIVSVDFFG